MVFATTNIIDQQKLCVMFTPVVIIFAIAIIVGLYFAVRTKNKSDKKDSNVQHGTESTSVRRNEA